MTAQVTKKFGNKWELYVGAENLTNYTQKKPDHKRGPAL